MDELEGITLATMSSASTEVNKETAEVSSDQVEVVIEEPEIDDPDVKLHQFYETLAEEVSPQVADVIVWKGVAKIKKLKNLPTITDKDQQYSQGKCRSIVRLFYDMLETEEKMKEDFIPSLRSIATCEWKYLSIDVAKYMFGALLDKTRGLSLVMDVLSPEDINRLLLAAVGTHCTNIESGIIKCPVPEFLSREEFSNCLKQGAAHLHIKLNRTSWLAMLAYSVDGVEDDVCSWLPSDFPWSYMLTEDMIMKAHIKHFDRNVMTKAKAKLFYIWKSRTSQKRKSTIGIVANKLNDDRKFADFLGVVLTTATFQVDHLQGKPSLIKICPTPQLAAKLFRHYIRYADEHVDISLCLKTFLKENVSDENIAATVKVAVEMKMVTEEVCQITTSRFITQGLVKSIAELLQSGHTHARHPVIVAISNMKDEMESFCCDILKVCYPDLDSRHCSDGNNNALHLAAKRGYTAVVKEILNQGFNKLLNKRDGHKENPVRPVTVAVQNAQYSTAIILLKAMEPADARTLFSYTNDSKPEINLHDMIKDVKSRKRSERIHGQEPKVNKKGILEESEVEERIKFIETALDKTIDGEKIDLSVLIQDENGSVPDSFRGSSHQLMSPEDAEGEELGKTLYHRIAQSDFEDLKKHESIATLTNSIWKDYSVLQGFMFILYIIFIGFLTTSLALGAKSSDPSKYSDSIDWFRLFCEIITFLFVIKDLLLEAYELYEIVRRRRKSENLIDSVKKQVFVEYYQNWQNFLDNLSILFVFLIIPFRIADSDIQWIFAALAFLFNGLRIFKYAIMFKTVSGYVSILIVLVKRDVPQFVTVFIVIIFSMGGALYLSLIGYYNDENIDAENNNETSEIYLLWGTGFRILAEGSVLTYTGPDGFNWLGVFIYWMFLFIVVVVLLNILIAQFSKSYEEETQNAQINVFLTRTEIIVRMENSGIARFFVQFVRCIRNTSSERNGATVKRLKAFIGEGEDDKPASSRQLEGLQTQTTKLGLQLNKHMDDNRGKSELGMKEIIKSEIGSLSEKFETTEMALEANKKEMDDKLTAMDCKLDNKLSEMDGKLVGLEGVVANTQRHVDEMHQLLLSMKKKAEFEI